MKDLDEKNPTIAIWTISGMVITEKITFKAFLEWSNLMKIARENLEPGAFEHTNSNYIFSNQTSLYHLECI